MVCESRAVRVLIKRNGGKAARKREKQRIACDFSVISLEGVGKQAGISQIPAFLLECIVCISWLPICTATLLLTIVRLIVASTLQRKV